MKISDLHKQTHGERLTRYESSRAYMLKMFNRAKSDSVREVYLLTALTALDQLISDQQRIVKTYGADTGEFK